MKTQQVVDPPSPARSVRSGSLSLMSRFKDIAHALLSSSEPKPNPFEEEAKVLISDLEPAAKAQVLAQLAVVYEVNQLKSAVDGLASAISLRS